MINKINVQTDLNNKIGQDKQSDIEKLNQSLLSYSIVTDQSEQNRLLAAAVHSAQDSILITTTELDYPGPEIVFVNKAFTKMTGYQTKDLIGKTPRILQGEKTDRKIFDQLKKLLRKGETFYGRTINYRKDGTEFCNQWHIEGIVDEEGKTTHYLAIQRDVTNEQQVETNLIYDASHDMLTNLYNRAWFIKELQKCIEKTQVNQDYLFALLFLDLDGFKLINDTLGHPVGDKFLQEIAHRLTNSIRFEDKLARLGGDEFTILVDNIDDLSIISDVVNKIQTALQIPFILEGHEVNTSGSIGITLSSNDYNKADDMLRDADLAMYRAKSLGKSRSAIFNKTMHRVAFKRLNLENDLRKALENNQLELYYQPIIAVEDQKIAGFEALLRWQHWEKGFISPAEFIPLAEEIGLIVPIGDWVMQEACEKITQWQKMIPNHPFFMNINLSPKQFAQKNLISKIEKIINLTNCDRHMIKFELTESLILEKEDIASVMLNQLKELGVKLCIDDFGTGYSSLSRLYKLPIDTLKIDRCFIRAIGKNLRKEKIVETIISLAHNLDMDVVAEGVETELQLHKIIEQKCEFVQGYLFSQAIDSKGIEELLSRKFLA